MPSGEIVDERFPETFQETVDTAYNSSFPGSIASQMLDAIPDSGIPGAGYVDCDTPEVCEGGDVNYRIHAAVRYYTIPGSRLYVAVPPGEPDAAGAPASPPVQSFSEQDVTFGTRTFEAMDWDGQSPFAPYSHGGDGRASMLGPALVVRPGQTMHIFMKNDLGDAMKELNATGQTVNSLYNRIKLVQMKHPGGEVQPFAPMINYTGPDLDFPILRGSRVDKEDMEINNDNMEGWETHGLDVFNARRLGEAPEEWRECPNRVPHARIRCTCTALRWLHTYSTRWGPRIRLRIGSGSSLTSPSSRTRPRSGLGERSNAIATSTPWRTRRARVSSCTTPTGTAPRRCSPGAACSAS